MKQHVAVEADAPPRRIWDTLADGRRWAEWNDRFEWAWAEGPLAPGTLFTVKPRRGRQTALRVEEAIPPRLLTLAVSFGPVVTLRLRLTISPLGDNASSIAADYEVSGPLAGFALRLGAAQVGRRIAGDLAKLAAYAAANGAPAA